MPIYEYRCRDCGAKFSQLVRSLSSSVEPACTACGSRSVTKLVSSFAYHSDEGPLVDDPSEAEPGPPRPVFGRKELNELSGGSSQ